MRIVLRIIAIAIWFGIVGTLRVIWTIWHIGKFGVLMASGTLGYLGILGWVLTLTVGPFAAVQLWRLRESGRIASLFLVGSIVLYYVVAGLFFRQPGVVESGRFWLAIGANSLLVVLLLFPSARRACQQTE